MIHYPLVSIVITSFNRLEDLKETIQRTRDIDYLNLEIIVVDGGSTDGSEEYIRSLRSETIKPLILGIDKGCLDKGIDADLCVFDINKPWIVDKNKLKSKSKNTPIEDRKLQGQVLKTFVKGELIYERV